MREQLHQYIESGLEYSVRDTRMSLTFPIIAKSYQDKVKGDKLSKEAIRKATAKFAFPYIKQHDFHLGGWYDTLTKNWGGMSMTVRYKYQNVIRVFFDPHFSRDHYIKHEDIETAIELLPETFILSCDPLFIECSCKVGKGCAEEIKIIFRYNGALVVHRTSFGVKGVPGNFILNTRGTKF